LKKQTLDSIKKVAEMQLFKKHNLIVFNNKYCVKNFILVKLLGIMRETDFVVEQDFKYYQNDIYEEYLLQNLECNLKLKQKIESIKSRK
jgi:hypothetical protein